MFRPTLLLAVLLGVAVYAAVPASAQPNRDLSILGFDEDDQFDEDDSITDMDPIRTTELGEVGAVLFAIKNQFKEIIQEIGIQIIQYISKILKHYKVKLLRKLGLYTLKDVFHTVFDGVSDFVSETSPEEYYDTKELVKVETVKPLEPTYSYNPFGLSSFFRSHRN